MKSCSVLCSHYEKAKDREGAFEKAHRCTYPGCQSLANSGKGGFYFCPPSFYEGSGTQGKMHRSVKRLLLLLLYPVRKATAKLTRICEKSTSEETG